MNKLKALFANAKVKTGAGVAVGSVMVMASAPSHAIADQTAAIAAISATSETNQNAVIAAVISLAAISFGIGYLLRWLSK